MSTLRIELPPKLIPVFSGEARYRGAYGGRGSGKTRSFAKMAAVRGLMFAKAGREGIVLCGREFMNSLDESSLAEVKAAIASEPWLAENYDVGEKYVRTRCGRVSFRFAGLRRNLDSIKSKALILILWVDEADPVSENAWQKIVPTVREHGSEIWVTWNPERKKGATHRRFRVDPPEGARIAEINYTDNPWFPAVLEQERLEDLDKRPDAYPHIWEGDFKGVMEGAYYARALVQAKSEGRISRVGFDPLMRVRVFCDLGGTGARADAFAMWPCQFVGREIRTRDYYEAQGQEIGAHIAWLHGKGYGPDRADIYLPHDGKTNDRIYDVSFESAFRDAGYTVVVVPNQGKGAAAARIEEARRVLPLVWFDRDTTEAGRDALGWYHEKRDDDRDVGLGPDHDWASHGADAFGMMAVVYTPPVPSTAIKYPARRFA